MIRVAPRSTIARSLAIKPTDESETAIFRDAVSSGSADAAHLARAELSVLHRRLVEAGQGHRLRDLMPRLHQAMKDDMAAIVATSRRRRRAADYGDLMRAGYSEPVVATFAPLIFGEPSHAELENVA